jgi:hypothetical protein
MINRAPHWNSAAGVWLRGVLERRPVRLATVALANKMARIAWALMTRKEVYHATSRLPSFSEGSESIGKHREFGQHDSEPLDQRQQPQLRHGGYQLVEHAALAEQRVGASLGGI